MSEDFHLVPLPADADSGDLLEALGPIEERPPESQYCVFRSGRERFCLPVLDVEEVLDWPLLTKLPLAPAFLIGIFNLRGAIVPLIDIAITEGRRPGLLLEQAPENVPHCIGMLRHDDRLALVIDLRRLLEVFPGPNI